MDNRKESVKLKDSLRSIKLITIQQSNQKKERTQITSNERGDMTIDFADSKIIRKYYEELYGNKL